MVDIGDLVEVDVAAPVFRVLALHQNGALADLELLQGEGAGADRILDEIAAVLDEIAVGDQGRVVGHAFRQAEIGRIQVEAHGMVVDLFQRSEEHTSELQSLMRISYAVFCLKKNKTQR